MLPDAVRRNLEVAAEKVRANGWSQPLVLALAAGLVLLLPVAFAAGGSLWSAAPLMLVAGSAVASGSVLGFLFGIPKVAQEPQQARGIWSESQYQVNTNLEQISDWLTKIIVGLGLVQLTSVPPRFGQLARFISQALTPAIPAALVGVILVYFASIGFLISYLWTRILLTIEFTRADREARRSPEFHEGLIQALLYQPPPDGFTRAIEAAEEYVRQFGAGNWRVWRSTACARGQQFAYLTNLHQGADGARREARNAALAAVRHVLAHNPDERDSLRHLWDPKLTTPQEDDLEVFADDEEFIKLLGPLSS